MKLKKDYNSCIERSDKSPLDRPPSVQRPKSNDLVIMEQLGVYVRYFDLEEDKIREIS